MFFCESTINTNTRVYFISVIQKFQKRRKLKSNFKDPRRLKISFENGKNLRVTYTIKQIDSIMVLLFHFRFEGKPDSEGNTCIAKVSRNVKERFKTRKTD